MRPTPYRLSIIACASLALIACGDDAKRRPLGGACTNGDSCVSGLCLNDVCLDPDADEDGDGLLNGAEGALGTNAFLRDSDGDGVEDADEVGDINAPADRDGDGKLDANESNVNDIDGDCIVDERDGDDASSETDLLEVADLGCCACGRCSDFGIPVAGSCQSGEGGAPLLVCDPSEGDVDDDGILDSCDAVDDRGLVFTPDEAQRYCALACEQADRFCGDGPTLPDTCVADCVAKSLRRGFALANYICLSSACALAPCRIDGAELTEDPRCDVACDRLEACNLFDAIETPEGSDKRWCRAACTANAQATPEGDAAFQCIVDAVIRPLSECGIVDLGHCIEPYACELICKRANGTQCLPGAPIYDTFVDQAACFADCSARPGFAQIAFEECGELAGCSDFGARCSPAPAVALSACIDTCSAFGEVCPDAFEIPDESGCQAMCTGISQLTTWVQGSDPSCVAELTAGASCPADPMGALFACMVPIAPRCAAACAEFNGCVPVPQGAGPPGDDCATGCTALLLSHPAKIGHALDCVDAADGCDQVLACAPAEMRDVCQQGCDTESACLAGLPLGGGLPCSDTCQVAYEEDATTFAEIACRVTAPCPRQSMCADLATAPVPADCITACASAGSSSCQLLDHGLCQRACQGAITAVGGNATASCVVAALGASCDLIATQSCDLSD